MQPCVQNSFEIVDLSVESAKGGSYDNHSIATVNDHEVRIGTMTEAYHWHCHPDSDESFLALEGGLFIDFDDRTIELLPGQMITVNRGVRHRTRPVGKRSVNLTFERVAARSEALEAPEAWARWGSVESFVTKRGRHENQLYTIKNKTTQAKACATGRRSGARGG